MSAINAFAIYLINYRRFRQVAACTVALVMPCQFAHAISAGDPNGTPADSPSNPYNPATMSGRLDANTSSSPFAGVVSIAGGGSGVLIDSTHVLTAGHVIGNSTPTGMTVFINYSGDKTFTITSQSVFVNQAQGLVGDIGIITLSQPVPSYVPTYHLYTQPLTAGTTLTFVGYGVAGDGVTGYYPPGYGSDTVKRVGLNNADVAVVNTPNGAGFAALNVGSQAFAYDFDGPDSSSNIFGDPTDPKNLTLGNNKETTIGNGDSGGPAFIYNAATGQYLVAGISGFIFDLNQTGQPITYPTAGHFGSGGGGTIVSAYTGPGGFLAAFAAPEPGVPSVFALGGLFLLAGRWHSRRRD